MIKTQSKKPACFLSAILSVVLAFGGLAAYGADDGADGMQIPSTNAVARLSVSPGAITADLESFSDAITSVAALSANAEATLTLLADIPNMDTSLVIPEYTALTLDLNGKNVVIPSTANVNTGLRLAGPGAKLTMKDGSAGGTGSITTGRSGPNNPIVGLTAGATDENPAVFILEGGKILDEYDVIGIASGFTGSNAYFNVTVNGGDIECTTGTPFSFTKSYVNLTINDGHLVGGTGTSHFFQGFSGTLTTHSLTINDGTFESAANFFTKNVPTTINGGTFRTTTSTVGYSSVTSSIYVNGGVFYCDTDDLTKAFSWRAPVYPEGKTMLYHEDGGYFALGDQPVVVDTTAFTLLDGNGEVVAAYSGNAPGAFNAIADQYTLRLDGDGALCYAKIVMPSFSKKSVTLDLNGHSLRLEPLTTGSLGGALHVTSGTLIIDDKSDTGGALDFGGAHYGITLGASGGLTLNAGLLSGGRRIVSSIDNSTKFNGPVTINGGEIRPDAGGVAISLASTSTLVQDDVILSISGGVIAMQGDGRAVSVTNAGRVSITGGQISSENSEAIRLTDIPGATIAGTAHITGGGTNHVVHLGSNPCTIGGNAYIGAAEGYEDKVYSAVYGRPTVEGDAVLSGGWYGIYGSGIINGGHFRYTELPFSASGNLTYKTVGEDTYILSPTPDVDGPYAGYYSLVTRNSLNWEDASTTPPTSKTYQDFEYLHYAIAAAEGLLKNSDNYGYEAAEAVRTALEDAEAALVNPNANQAEIDYWCDKLNVALNNMEGSSDLDPATLPDGVYAVDIATLKEGTSGASMTTAATDQEALVYVEDGKASIRLTFHPAHIMSIWGHLTNLWIYKGNTAVESRSLASGWNGQTSVRDQYMEEGTYLSRYYVENDALAVPVLYEGGAQMNYPYIVSLPLRYRSTAQGENVYVMRVSVDVMTGIGVGDQNVDLHVKWSTLRQISAIPSLRFDVSEISLLVGGSQTVTATLSAAAGYAVTWSSDNESVATVDASSGLITAVSEGGCTVKATARKAGAQDLVKTVSVTVAAPGSVPVSVGSAQTSDDGKTVTATLTGDVLITNGAAGDEVQVAASAVTIDATSTAAPTGITTARVIIPVAVAEALTNKEVSIETDMGAVKLTQPAVAQIATGLGTEGSATLTVAEATRPAGLEGTYHAIYEIGLRDGDGASVVFSDGQATITVPCNDAGVKWAYHIENGKRASRSNRSVSWRPARRLG
jgi:hypothetical protein